MVGSRGKGFIGTLGSSCSLLVDLLKGVARGNVDGARVTRSPRDGSWSAQGSSEENLKPYNARVPCAGELDYALHEESPFGAANSCSFHPAEGQYGFGAGIVSSSSQRLRAGPYRASHRGQP